MFGCLPFGKFVRPVLNVLRNNVLKLIDTDAVDDDDDDDDDDEDDDDDDFQ